MSTKGQGSSKPKGLLQEFGLEQTDIDDRKAELKLLTQGSKIMNAKLVLKRRWYHRTKTKDLMAKIKDYDFQIKASESKTKELKAAKKMYEEYMIELSDLFEASGLLWGDKLTKESKPNAPSVDRPPAKGKVTSFSQVDVPNHQNNSKQNNNNQRNKG